MEGWSRKNRDKAKRKAGKTYLLAGMLEILGIAGACIALSSAAARAVADAPTFSNASLHGDYRCQESGFTGAGFNPGPPISIFVAEIGAATTLHFDGAGHVTGSSSSNFAFAQEHGPQLCNIPFTGTYSIAPDGTGTESAFFTPEPAAICGSPGTLDFKLVIERDGQKFESMSTTPFEVVSSVCEKI